MRQFTSIYLFCDDPSRCQQTIKRSKTIPFCLDNNTLLYSGLSLQHLNLIVGMSSSLHKKKVLAQKENSNRLSNSKIMSAYSGANLAKINCSEFVCPLTNTDDKPRNSTKRTARLKTNRKHQLSVEQILSNKYKEPYSMRSLQIEKQKTKPKRKKKDRTSNQSSKFIIPVMDFSRSNSLIVFSEKDSTINGNLFNKSKNFFVPQDFTPTQAAIIIQKNWRGYLTRKLLEQYIMEEETKLVSVINKLKSREDSFAIEDRNEEQNFSVMSSINEDVINSDTFNPIHRESDYEYQYESHTKHYVMYTTEQQSSNEAGRESPQIFKSFFKNNRTEPDIQSTSKTIGKQLQIQSRKIPALTCQLNLHSSVINYNISTKLHEQLINSHLDSEDLSNKMDRVKNYIENQWKEMKIQLKEKLTHNEVSLEEMIKRSGKLKEIFENSKSFLCDVTSEVEAMVQEMADIVENGLSAELNQNISMNKNRMQPKSQVFTIELDDNEPDLPSFKESFTQGQVKLQNYLHELIEEYEYNYAEMSELEYLCEVLKINSDRGVSNILDRCLVQFTIEIITEGYPLHDLNRLVYERTLQGGSKEEDFLKKWIAELDKWEMGPIQEVTIAMESSSFINCEVSKSQIYQQK